MFVRNIGRWTSLFVLVGAACGSVASCGSAGDSSLFTQHTDDASIGADGSPTGDDGSPTSDDSGNIIGNSDASDACVPQTCQGLGYSCGQNADGCGGTLDCGTCAAPQYCGGGGFSKCGGNSGLQQDGAPLCTPETCASLGYTCGAAGDGCGGLLQCGTCTAPQYCGGAGFNLCGGNNGLQQDGAPLCTPKTCAQLGYNCGAAGDGCGNLLNCGTCNNPQYCGGGGFNVCGGNNGLQQDGAVPCTPKTCAQLGYNCGAAGDGCGNSLNCGACNNPQYCGGGGFNVCGGNNGLQQDGAVSCTPKTCAQLGYNCGPASDGCGGLLQCGACSGSNICGGGGKPGVCGNGTCTNLCNQQVTCGGGVSTTITGRVVAGTLPQYGAPDPVPGVLVYVPNTSLQPFSTGVTCSQCGADVSGSPLVQTTTAVNGTFSLSNMPVGSNIPVVIQLGRWRREVFFNVPSCATTAVGDIHMPRNKGEGNIPFTALSTGQVDPLECVLLKMGIDQAEFTAPGGGGRVEMYFGNGATQTNGVTIPDETSLVNSLSTMDAHDQQFFPCWGDPVAEATKINQGNLLSYVNGGGRAFTTHYSYVWLYNYSPFSTTANWAPDTNLFSTLSGVVDQSAQTGQQFAQWLAAVGLPSTNTISNPREDSTSVNSPPSTQWMYSSSPVFPLAFSFDTPINNNPQCGKVFYLDFHVTNGSSIGNFPGYCPAGGLTAQEKLLEYMIWQLAQCVGPLPQPTCTPLTCAQQGINCGPAGNGCGGQLSCGTCQAPQVCGGGGYGKCGYPDGGSCAPLTCTQQNINCGPAGNGCGGLIQCGSCTPPQTCGGGGSPGKCGHPDAGSCIPESCGQQNINCGFAGDGCGNQLFCGNCTPPQTCGGGGSPGKCGYPDGGSCAPETCAQQNINCGPAGDGCGNLIQCGSCTPPQTCGGGGTPGQCGYPDGGTCTPQTCASQNVRCGPAGDGCGNLLDCGTCTLPQTCGGGGTPGQCGGGSH